jgi:hypothetical protein
MELRHYAAQPLKLDRSRVYEQQQYFKPRGLWVSVPGEDDWPEWCRSESFAEDRLAVEHDVTLSESFRILVLDSAAALQEFTKQYRVNLIPHTRYSDSVIDWPTVAGKYDGIIITPYQWSCRMELMWYYPWDCASGCIWNLDAIKSVTIHDLDNMQITL